ncbi:transposase, partial [Sphingopyxis sp. LK2115]|uniref:transposase n=1 Tax=Sphingopyxis sp. LK2115 TaxID=2744558 RepID=UPI0039815700
MHALVDADGRPVALRLTGGQVHDSQQAEALLAATPEAATLLGDKGCDSNAIRDAAAARNAWANIPSRSNRKQRFALLRMALSAAQLRRALLQPVRRQNIWRNLRRKLAE